jgi:hypothetical protein
VALVGYVLIRSLRSLCVKCMTDALIDAEDAEIRRGRRETQANLRQYLLGALLHILPVPRLVEVGAKAEAPGIAH